MKKYPYVQLSDSQFDCATCSLFPTCAFIRVDSRYSRAKTDYWRAYP